ncbi:PFE-CTERM domain-containing protein [Trichormus variabilis]|uniref:Uncharacterized protein n=1 Tax=Trichormus variabilis SAG 1403-4b TaxID=447716 RepID=A0A3S1CRX5_ANAVA|nr:hypothetical protein [Trichormus variabilis]MBD2627894.1 hypothetical protein [Trichormus variabilis FACHB-164]RUS97274.1 hypothetical protein DSM107003_20150 [Trichormus variabilis SAG 1403-4b]
MKLVTKLGIATAGIALTMALTETKPAQALTWNWSFNGGAEAGTFDTNGTFANTSGAFDFTINAATVAVTSSTVAPLLVGKTFTEIQPTEGFLWNGTAPTQFYRNGGTLTNGSRFSYAPSSLWLAFTVSNSLFNGRIYNPSSFNPSFDLSNGTLTPIGATPVPFDFSTNLGLGLFGAYTLGNLALRKAKAARKAAKV